MEKRMEHLTETDKRGDAAAAAYEWVEAAIFALVCVVLVFTFLFRIVGVDGESMQNTLMNHDRLILTGALHAGAGDIVVINRYTAEPLVKRVIAVEGDTHRHRSRNAARKRQRYGDRRALSRLPHAPPWI